MLTLQEKLTAAENRISKIHTSTDHEISKLKEEVKLLKTENEFLKNNSAQVRADICHLNENLTDLSNTFTDVKIEVRYLSITLFDINTNLRETAEILQHHNISMQNMNSDIANNDRKQSAALLELGKQHVRFIDDIRNTTRTLNADIEQFQTDQWRLSASVSSLELFRNNQTNNKCVLFLDQKQEVAFTAGVTSSSATWNSGTLIFDVVIMNTGNGYNPSTGVFTSPIGGTFVFYVSAVEYLSKYLRIDVVLNSVSKVRALGEGSAGFQTGTNMVVLNLQKGDSVWVKHSAGKGYHSESVPVTTFSGFLIL
uniref:C1q domain-containing protein n=1 Tax=Magallana gigas TaxID=29159 RepID=A0A8W8JAF0_MAGGI